MYFTIHPYSDKYCFRHAWYKTTLRPLHCIAHHIAHVDMEIQLGQINGKQHQRLPGYRLRGQVTAAMMTLVFAALWMADTWPLFAGSLGCGTRGPGVCVTERLWRKSIRGGLGHGSYKSTLQKYHSLTSKHEIDK